MKPGQYQAIHGRGDLHIVMEAVRCVCGATDGPCAGASMAFGRTALVVAVSAQRAAELAAEGRPADVWESDAGRLFEILARSETDGVGHEGVAREFIQRVTGEKAAEVVDLRKLLNLNDIQLAADPEDDDSDDGSTEVVGETDADGADLPDDDVAEGAGTIRELENA